MAETNYEEIGRIEALQTSQVIDLFKVVQSACAEQLNTEQVYAEIKELPKGKSLSTNHMCFFK